MVTRFVCLAILSGCFANSARAQDDATPSEGARGMPSVVRVAVPVPASGRGTLFGSAGYGYIDPALDLTGSGHRLVGTVGGAVAITPLVLVGLDARGRMDSFGSADDDQAHLYGEPRITARLQMPATPDIHWGAQLDARLVGAEAPDIDFGATSPSLKGLLGARLAGRTWLGAELGFHLDNSENALPPPNSISSADRITVGASSSPAIAWGAGVSHRLASGLELLGEVSGQILVGASAPQILESPWGIAAGARQPLGKMVDVMLSADVSLSARPEFEANDLVPIEPRFGAQLWAIIHLGVEEEAAPPPPEAPPVEEEEVVEPEEPEIPMAQVRGTVVDEGGRPLSDVQVTLLREGADPIVERTYADGSFVFEDVPLGAVQVVVETPGYEKKKVALEGEERQQEVVLYRALPAGQVKGEVRDLKGNPVQARIEITPGDKVIEVGPDGKFDLELVPGRYTVRFEHPELSPQKRYIRVQDRGVVILNIALSP